ncbi:MAG: chorismate-binding protein [Planctomycetota bacterium]
MIRTVVDPSLLQGLTPLAALERLHEQERVVCLLGGPGPGALLQWGMQPLALHGPDDLPRLPGRLAAARGDGWPADWQGGVLLQLDYEFPVGAWAETLPTSACPGRCWPWRRGLRWDAAGRCRLIARDAADRSRLLQDLQLPAPDLPAPRLREPLSPAWDAAGHHSRVERIRAAIAAGDCYLPFQARLAPGPSRDLAVFRRLITGSPAGYACFIRDGGQSLLSHSPECFLCSDAAAWWSWPIKGTRRREPGREAALRAELQAAVKDGAELAMIVDLVRNDLARVARPGGVTVARPPHVIDLDYVHHLVAAVRAEARPGTRLADLLRAAFPAGSITGAPKRAAMRLIHQLESGPRGPYCGTFGWYGSVPSGDHCALAVAIRSMIIDADGAVQAHVGGGIVADSDPQAEWQEVQAKLAGMARALGADPCGA